MWCISPATGRNRVVVASTAEQLARLDALAFGGA